MGCLVFIVIEIIVICMIEDNLRQPCWNDTDWLYVQVLSSAIESVRPKYVRECIGKRKFHLERVFSYELYYKWQRLLTHKKNNPEKLMLNAELTKHYDKLNRYKFPDLVLHGNYANREKQYLICEIKSSRNQIKGNALKKDVESLYGGVIELGYHCGIFIYLGSKVTNIVSRIRNVLHDFANYEEGRYLFIGVNGIAPHYEIL